MIVFIRSNTDGFNVGLAESPSDGRSEVFNIRRLERAELLDDQPSFDRGEDGLDQIDDVLEGASSAACLSCHNSFAEDTSDRASLEGHAAQNGWYPQTFEEGRQTIIDAAN